MKMNLKKQGEALFLLSLSLILLWCAYVRAEEGVIRMHVIAQSDSRADQHTKERLRLALLPRVNDALASAASHGQAAEALQKLLPELEREAEALTHGRARAALSRQSYPARFDSGSFLPAGRYMALTITLGDGEGHNWWGVVYPGEEEDRGEIELHWWIADWWQERALPFFRGE